MEKAGATVHVIAADVSEPADLRRVRQLIDSGGTGLHGVVHAAGLPGGGMIEVKDHAAAVAVLRPKLAGTLALQAVFGDLPLDFVVLFSSITSIAGGLGQVDYCAANAFLDAYARSAHGWRARVVSANWGGWAEVGMAAEVAAPDVLRGQAAGATTALDHPILTGRGDGWVHGTIGPDSHWVLDEHRIGGVAVVPGTAHLECAREAVARLLPGPGAGGPVELRDVSFLEPLAVPDGTTCRYRVDLGADGEFHIASGQGEDRRVHAEFHGTWAEPDTSSPVDVAAIRARCRPRSGSHRTGVVSYGSRWDCLRETYAGDGEDLALIEVPEVARADLHRWVLHPALLDIATSFGFSDAEGSYLPLAYGRVLVRDRLPGRFYSHLRYQDAAPAGLMSATVTLVDVDGRVLVEIADFTLRRVDPQALAAGLNPDRAEVAGSPESQADGGIRPGDGVQAFRRLLAGDVGHQVAVVPSRVAAVRERVRRVAESVTAATVAKGASPGAAADAATTAYVAPRTVLEERLVEVWQSVLGVERVGIDDDFFAIGGNSLVAVQLIAQLRKAVRVKLPMRSLFETPTVAGLAERVETLRAAPAPAPVAPVESVAPVAPVVASAAGGR
jgi:acyl carrier protein